MSFYVEQSRLYPVYLPPRKEGQVYLGMIIPVPEPYAGELQKVTKTDGVPPHVTIVEPRAVDREQVPDIQAQAAEICRSFSPFVISFGNIGDFRPVSPVVYIEVQRGHEACKELAKRLRFGPLDTESRFPYYPHITLGTNVTNEDLDRVASLSKRSHGFFMVDGVDCSLLEPNHVEQLAILQLGSGVPESVTGEIPEIFAHPQLHTRKY